MPAVRPVPKSVKVAAVWLVLTAVNGPLALVPRDTVYPVARFTVLHPTVMLPLLLFAVAVTPVGAVGGIQTGLAVTSFELGEVQTPSLAVTT
jgi:hypothetical protein